MIRSTFFAALTVAALASAASAQPSSVNARLAAACGKDVQTLCPGVLPGGGRIGQCLKAHASQVSPGCKSAIAAAMAAQHGAKPAG
jgi:Cysteine rich repeat